jgi:hypothetical protein
MRQREAAVQVRCVCVCLCMPLPGGLAQDVSWRRMWLAGVHCVCPAAPSTPHPPPTHPHTQSPCVAVTRRTLPAHQHAACDGAAGGHRVQ